MSLFFLDRFFWISVPKTCSELTTFTAALTSESILTISRRTSLDSLFGFFLFTERLCLRFCSPSPCTPSRFSLLGRTRFFFVLFRLARDFDFDFDFDFDCEEGTNPNTLRLFRFLANFGGFWKLTSIRFFCERLRRRRSSFFDREVIVGGDGGVTLFKIF